MLALIYTQLEGSQGLCRVKALVTALAWPSLPGMEVVPESTELGSHQIEKMNESLAWDQFLRGKKLCF